jgi:hypothetical protein
MAAPTKIIVTIQDDDNELTHMSFFLASSVNTLAGILAAVEPVVEGIAACITGTITEVSFTKPIDTTGWTLTPSLGVSTDRLYGGRFIWRTADNAYATVNLPTLDGAKVQDPGEDIDLTDLDIDAFHDAFLAESTVTSQDVALTALVKAYETHGGRK